MNHDAGADDLMTRAQIVREYGRDKRTVERRLVGLDPAIVEQRGSLLVRYWRRAQVEERMRERSAADELRFQLERLHAARADRLEIERRVRSGELCEVNEICKEMSERFYNAREKLLQAPARFAPTIARINATHAAEAATHARMKLLRQLLEEVFAELERPMSFERHDA